MGETTTIQVTEATADDLHERKGRGESYNDVIRRLLDEKRSSQPAN